MFVVITPKYDGSHGYDVVGSFESEQAASDWLNGRDGMIKPLVSPDAHLAFRAETEANDQGEES